MGFYDRPYLRRRAGEGAWGGGGVLWPRPTPMTLAVMIACAAVFLSGISAPVRQWTLAWLPFVPTLPQQFWRLITFQFVHANVGHFVLNMLGLYFFAPPLERAWGGRRFLAFYLLCGAFGGICYLAASGAAPAYRGVPLVGASGGILGCLTACAVLHREMIILIVPIRWAAAILTVLYVLSLLLKQDLADAAHLGGMAAAAGWTLLVPAVLRRLPPRSLGAGRWEKKIARRRRQEEKVDRVLEKIRQHGIGSLSWWQRRQLRRATRRQREEDRAARRAGP